MAEQIGRYQIISKIGEGGMGVVYKARHPTLDMIVALKTISASLDATPQIRQRFHTEARSAAQLSHENIIRIYDYDEYEGKAYLVLEFLTGSDLRAEIKKIKEKQSPPFSLGQSLQIMLGVCRGLSHAHQRGIYHRDIKPANIFLTNIGQVKILDFGLAKIVSDQATLTGAQMGTVAYMSPEQIEGKTIDQRSDIFSTGVLFYELLTYSHPFAGETWSEILFKIIHTEPTPVDMINKLIPPELSAIIQRAIAKDRAKRYQTMRELLEDLEQFRQKLEVRKQELQSEAKNIIDRMEKLLANNQDLLKERAEQLKQVREDQTTILQQSRTAAASGETAKQTGFGIDYWDIVEICARVREEYNQLSTLVQKRERFEDLIAETRTMFRDGDLVGALETVNTVLRDSPSNPNAAALKEKIVSRLKDSKSEEKKHERAQEFCRLAEASFASDDFAGCIAFSAEVLKLIPNHKQAIALLERAQQRIKEDAQREESQREEARHKAEQELTSAREALVAGNYAQARAAAESALSFCPDLKEASGLLLEIAEAEQKHRKKQVRQRLINDLMHDARALQKGGKAEAALERIKEVLAMEPDHREAIALRDQIEELLKAQQRSDELFKLAAEKYASDDLTECFPLLNEALKLRPGHPSARALLEQTKQKIKERAEREERRRQAMAALDRARATFTQGDLQGARQELEILAREHADMAEVTRLLEEVHRAEEESRIKQELEQKVDELLRKAESHLQAEEENPALDILGEIQKMAPDSPKAAKLAGEIGELHRKRDRERQERISRIFKEAEEAEKAGLLERAAELAGSVLAQDAAHGGARDLIARIEAEIARRKRQEEERRERIQELLQSAEEARSTGNLEKAIRAFDEILAMEKSRQDLFDLRKGLQVQLEAERARQARLAEAAQQKRIGLRLVRESRFRDGLAALQNAREVLKDDPEVLSAIAEAEQAIRAKELQLLVQQRIFECRTALLEESFYNATEQVNEVLRLDPENAEARELQIRIDRAQKEKQLREKVIAYLAGSHQALGKEDYDGATELASKALLLDGENSEARELLQKIDQARRQKLTREKIASLFAQSGKALSSEAFEEADARAREILLLDPDNVQAKELIQHIQSAHEQWHRQKRVTSLISEARSSRGHGEFEKAVRQLEEVLQLDPENTTADSLLKRVAEDIRIQDEKRRRERIEELLEQVQLEKSQGRFEEAIRILDEILSLDGGRRDARELRRQIITELDAEKARQIKTAEAEHEKQQGFRMLAQKRYQESLSALSRAKAVLGTDEELEAALAEAEAGLKSQELYSRIQSDLANARQALRNDDFSKAADLANAVLYLEPQNAGAQELLRQIDRIREDKAKRDRVVEFLSLGRQATGREDFEQAVHLANQVLLLEPQNADARDLLKRSEELQEQKDRRTRVSTLLAQSNDSFSKHQFGDAEAKAREVLLLDPQNAEANSLLQRINEAQGKRRVENQIAELLVEVHDAREKQQFAVALSRIAEVLRLDPRHKEARFLAKNIEKDRDAFEKQKLRQAKSAASEQARLARQQKPLPARIVKWSLYSIALILVILIIWKIRQQPPGDDSYAMQTRILFREGKYQTALQILENWLKQEPGNAEAGKLRLDAKALLSEVGVYESAIGQGSYSRAATALTKISKINAADPDLAQRWLRLDEIFSQPFQDSFLAGLGSWTSPATWKIIDKRLSVREGVGLIKGRYYKNFEADFNVQFVRGDTASWLVRASDDRNYYLFQLTGPGGNPPNSMAGYAVANGKRVKTILQPIGVGLNLGKQNAQFRIRPQARGTKITHIISSAESPEEPEQGPYEVYDNTFSGGTFGFKAESNVEFSIFGPLNVYSIIVSAKQ